MASNYTAVAFSSRQPDTVTATKLNKLRDDLSVAIASGGGGTGTGDMTKAVYDTNNNGKVDTCDSVPWTSVVGRPTVIGDMTKAVYDTDGDSKVDVAATADAVSWTGVTGKPATFPATAHGPTHTDIGADTIPVTAVGHTGLCGRLSGDPATFLNGVGGFTAPAGTVDPGTWTALTLQTGWSAPSQAEYRVQTIGAIKTVFFRGFVQAAYSALGTVIANLPSLVRPSVPRIECLGGAQSTGTPSDVAAYILSVSTGGDLVAYFLSGGQFVWPDPSKTQLIYLDGLVFSL